MSGQTHFRIRPTVLCLLPYLVEPFVPPSSSQALYKTSAAWKRDQEGRPLLPNPHSPRHN